jgi:hypothetical protein
MRNLTELDRYRIEMTPELRAAVQIASDYDRTRNGAFMVKIGDVVLAVLASSGMGWDHVSVSTTTRCPTWEEMESVARLFFQPTEVAMQLHLPASDHINIHPFTLHWWRPWSKLKKIPLPPKIMV